MTGVADAMRDLVTLHRVIGSKLPGHLRPPVGDDLLHHQKQIGFELHADVRELYQFADGVDEQSWYERCDYIPELLPNANFPMVSASSARTSRLRHMAQVSGDDPDRLWQPGWFAVFALYPTGVVAVDCRTVNGTVWFVDWEGDDIVQAAADLPTMLRRTVTRMKDAGVSVTADGYELELPDWHERDWYLP